MKDNSWQQLVHYKEQIDKQLALFFKEKTSEAKKISRFTAQLTESLTDYTLRGGKRIRPLFFIFGYQAIAGKVTTEAIKASLCTELLQSSLLIHDDIIDQDIFRRGGKTIHYQYSSYLKTNNDAKNKHFGETMAIIIGNLAANFAYEIISNSKFSPNNKNKAIKSISNLINKVNYGQSLDVLISENKEFCQKDIENIHYYKTATYTVELPLLIGVTLAGASDKIVKKISKFAYNIGRAFQIQDDIIGMFGDEKKSGKPAYSDLKEGKKTFLILKALEKANQKDRKIVNSILGRNDIGSEELKQVRGIIIKTSSLKYSLNLSNNFIDNAITILNNLPIDAKSKKGMQCLAEYIINKDEIKFSC